MNIDFSSSSSFPPFLREDCPERPMATVLDKKIFTLAMLFFGIFIVVSILQSCLGENRSLNGRGKKIFPNGKKYKGIFQSGLLHGKGKKIFSNGDIQEGVFKREN